MTFLMTHEFDVLSDFHGVQEKAMKHPDLSWCANSWQFNEMKNSWVMIIPLTGNF